MVRPFSPPFRTNVMLDAIRRGTASILVKIMLGLLILSFAVWGIGDIFVTPAQNPVVATVGGKDITANEFLLAYQRELNELSEQLGQPVSPEQARDADLVETTLRDLLSRTILIEAAKENGVAIGDDIVRTAIVTNPAFQTPTGRFDRLGFEQLLRNYGLTEAAYVDSMRQDLAREQIVTSVAVGALTPRALVEPIFKYRLEVRVAELVVIAPTNAPDPPTPSDEELATFHRDNAPRYTAPEYRSISYLAITPESLFAEIAISEQQLRAAYDNQIDDFTTIEQRDVAQLVYGDEEKAKGARARALKGEAFDTIAKDSGAINHDATELGLIAKRDLPGDLGEKAFLLAEGGISDVIKSDFGWHVLRVKKVVPGGTASFETVRPKIEETLKRDKAVDNLFQLANKLEDEMAGGASLEEAASKANQTVVTLPALDRFGRDEVGSTIADLPERTTFLNVAFSSPLRQVSPPQETRDGIIFFVRVNSSTPPALLPLGQVRDQVESDFRRRQRLRAAEVIAKEIEAATKNGKTLGEIATERGLANRKTPALTRTSGLADPSISAEFVSDLFAASVGDLLMKPTPTGDGFVVGRLEAITAASPEERAVPLAQMRDQINRSMGTDILFQYQLALESRMGVSVNRQRLANLDLSSAVNRAFRGGRRF
jgi:peptidyl-prolyl cis-trans isomerase D